MLFKLGSSAVDVMVRLVSALPGGVVLSPLPPWTWAAGLAAVPVTSVERCEAVEATSAALGGTTGRLAGTEPGGGVVPVGGGMEAALEGEVPEGVVTAVGALVEGVAVSAAEVSDGLVVGREAAVAALVDVAGAEAVVAALVVERDSDAVVALDVGPAVPEPVELLPVDPDDWAGERGATARAAVRARARTWVFIQASRLFGFLPRPVAPEPVQKPC